VRLAFQVVIVRNAIKGMLCTMGNVQLHAHCISFSTKTISHVDLARNIVLTVFQNISAKAVSQGIT